MSKPVWLLLALLAVVVAHAQPLENRRALTQYVLQNWQQEDGLPQSSITALVQTQDGYIWIGTNQGLVRFDGVRFTTYTTRTHPALGSNSIWALLEAYDGRLWIGTNAGGLVAYKDGAFRRITTADGLSHNTVLSLAEAVDGRLWAGTTEGYSVLAGDSILPVEQDPRLRTATVYTLSEMKPGEMWLGTRQGLFVHKATGEVEPLPMRMAGDQPIVSTLARDRGGRIWVGTRGDGLWQYAGDGFSAVSGPLGIRGKTINNIYEDPIGTLWITTFGGGLHRYRAGKVDRIGLGEGLVDADVISVLYDREGSLWFGTKRGGLHRLKNSKFVNYGALEGLPSDNISCVLARHGGDLWVGTTNGGVALLDPERGVQALPARLAALRGSYIRALYEDAGGGLWLAIYGSGLAYYQNGVLRRFTPAQGLADIFVRSILAGPDGSVWFGTRGGLNRYAGGRIALVRDTTEEAQPPILCMAHGAAGPTELWIGTDGQGLLHYHNGRFERFGEQDSLLSTVVLATYYDSLSNAVWVGTNAGMNLLKDGRVYTLASLDPVFSGAVLQIIADAYGNLWLGTNDGMYQVSRQPLLAAAVGTGPAAAVVPIRYDRSDGMRSAESVANTQPGVAVTPDGRIWFATIQGLTVVDPTAIASNRVPPPVVVEKLVVDGAPVAVDGPTRVAPDAKVIEVQYTGLSFQVPKKVRFRYRLKGFSEAWLEADTRRSAFFTGLPPGAYTFEVLAQNNDGVWSSAPAVFQFVVAPNFYETAWFYVLLTLLVVGGVGAGVRWRLLRGERERRKLAVAVAERTEEVEAQKKALSARNQDLAQANRSLSSKSEALQQALISLQRTQDQLVASEKMAVLGQLVANIAHEINSPISAITASARSTSRQLPTIIQQIADRARQLTEHEIEAFARLANAAAQPRTALTTREERTFRRKAEAELEKLGAPKRDEVAYTLAQLGVWEELKPYAPILVRPDAPALVELVYTLASVIRNSETILHAARKTGKIVQALKTYAHHDREARRVPHQVAEGIETVLTIYDNQLRKGVRVVRSYAPVPDVWVYPDEIEQVWTNLLSNAILAMSGEGTLKVGVAPAGAFARITFEDSGQGIPPEVLPHIFDPFYTTRPKGQGSGLGLDICRKIVHQHCGTIEVHSQPGQTVFAVELPLATEEQLQAHATQAEAATPDAHAPGA